MISFTSSKIGETVIQNTPDPGEKEGGGLAAPEAAAEKASAPEVEAEEAVVESSAVEKTSGYISPIRKSA